METMVVNRKAALELSEKPCNFVGMQGFFFIPILFHLNTDVK